MGLTEQRKEELLNKGRYEMWLAKQCARPVNELKAEKEEYKVLLEEIALKEKAFTSKKEFVNSQIRALDYALTEYKNITLRKITPTSDHIRLLKNMNFVGIYYGDLVSIGVEGKRPFGNSDIYKDISRILEWKLPNDELSDKQQERANQLLEELPFVLNNIIKKLKIGEYR